MMSPNKTIVENAMNSADHETLVGAVKAAGLVETLQGPGPFTVFAPVDSAFNELPTGTVPTLLDPANVDKLRAVLTYHVISGNMTHADLEKAVMQGGGMTTLTTVNGATLTVKQNGNNLVLVDQAGRMANISVYDVAQSNGVIHVIDKVLLPHK